MLSDTGLAGLATMLLAMQPLVYGQPANLTRRNMSPSDLSNYRSGLFVVGNTQTSCEMALFDSSAGFVAASCLSYTSSGDVDNTLDYRVAVTAAGGDSARVNSVTMVDAHPDYNPKTNANNIAVLHWGDPNDITWRQKIGQDRASWSNMFYTCQTMKSVGKSSWNTPAVQVISGSSDASGCSGASNLYKSNTDWFSCIVQSTTSIANGNCQTPYGAAWAVYQPNNMAVAALYSHSAIYKGSEMCGSTGDQFHYFTLLQPYVKWAAEMTGRKVGTYTSDSSFSYSGSVSFGMANNLAPAVFGVNTVSGDRYPAAKAYTGPPGSASNSDGGSSNNGGNNNGGGDGGNISSANRQPEDSQADDNTTNTHKDDSSSHKSASHKPVVTVEHGSTITLDDGEDDTSSTHSRSRGSRSSDGEHLTNGEHHTNGDIGLPAGEGEPGLVPGGYGPATDGLSRTAIIALATAVPLGTILILVVLFFVYKWWRRRENARNWDPKNEAANIDRMRIIEQLSGPAVDPNLRNSTPPAYIDYNFRSAFEPAGKS
ncbi:hypothetical protein H4R19_002618 [Coemansia spiralis]|nr:hypothetical protein H4R19_002618 [Coemansia spiralis]